MNLPIIKKKTETIVRSAAKLLRRGTGNIRTKGNSANLVTDADICIQAYLQKKLHALVPEASFYCEEESEQNRKNDLVWIIDPIDGTTNFARKIPFYSISVALWKNGSPLVGVVFAPQMNLMFTAVQGKGAFCNGKPIQVSDEPFERSLFSTALCLYEKRFAGVCANIMQLVHQQCSDIRRLGSCALELCFLALGVTDLFFEIRTYPWDYAAAFLILKEAGGYLSGYQKEELGIDSITMLIGANSKENFEKLSSIVSHVIQEKPTYTE